MGVLLPVSEGVFFRRTSTCAPNEYWCQDRCGSDDYGETCCQTPDGQHNLCGAVCNATGGCDRLSSNTMSTPLPAETTCPNILSSVTAYQTITEVQTYTDYVTTTFSGSCGSMCISQPQRTSAATPSTWTASDGQTIISSGSVIVIGGTETISVPTGFTTLTTGGQTFTFGSPSPLPSTATSSGQGAGATTWTQSDGDTVVSISGVVVIETFTLSPSGSGSPGAGATTWTNSNGQTIISSSGVVVIGTNPPVTLPTGTVSIRCYNLDGIGWSDDHFKLRCGYHWD
ncbi:hypothetical protein C8A00DRAFT_43634 [Chaetomidium leptoderma]|uniref:Uncharacterized protein n=1 Tax=Chaetomidium leptoderma TaxID=669021 RepID=A0AAN6VKX7_9PEZI|nr:hypothetical protein C8A00DRAFT_43634 [Chaetomidium leptoderma]